MIKTEGEKREKKRRYFILFNDTLVCAQPPKKPTGSISKSGYAGTMKYKFESKIMFKEMSVVPEGPPDIPFSFILNTPKASLMLSCTNAAEKHAWLEDIKAVVREHQQQDAFHESEW
jgi:hypothetical protein